MMTIRPSASTRVVIIDHDERLNALLTDLDIMLPETNGLAVCRKIRETSRIPIVMLTARGDVTDRIVDLELSADDYLPKPFEPPELVPPNGERRSFEADMCIVTSTAVHQMIAIAAPTSGFNRHAR
jgi:CheY-like chemotaxis protein